MTPTYIFRHPSAAVGSIEGGTPPRGRGAHWSGVPGFDWALRRKWYVRLTTILIILSIKFACFIHCCCCFSKLEIFIDHQHVKHLWWKPLRCRTHKSLMCFWQVGWPNCSPGLILLQPSSLMSSSLLGEAGLSLTVRQILMHAWILSFPTDAIRATKQFHKA